MKLRKSNVLKFAKELEEDFSIKYLSETNEKDLQPHYHKFLEMVFIVEGKVAYQMPDGVFVLKPGDIMFIKALEKHYPMIINHEAMYERITLQIKPEKLEALSKYGVDLGKCFRSSKSGIFRFPYYAQNSIRMILGKILSIYQEKPFGHELLADAYITELFVKVTELFSDGDSVAPVEELHTLQLLSMVDSYITENIDSAIRIDDLANFVCMNKYSFMRYFKQLSGCTVYQYIINKRLETAESLIKAGAAFSTAAEKSGFNDYSCFYRCFVNKHDMSPQKYYDAVKKSE